jgi:hypothetical protein
MTQKTDEDYMAEFYNRQSYEYRATYWRWLYDHHRDCLLTVASKVVEKEARIQRIIDDYVWLLTEHEKANTKPKPKGARP